MKKAIRRIFAFTLALTLMLAVAGTASAATVYWTSSDGTPNHATAVKTGDWYYVYQPVKDATIARHTSGTTSLLTWPAGNYASYEVTWPSSARLYRLYLDSAVAQEGLSRTARSTAPESDFYVIDANVPSGTYSYGMEIRAYNVDWYVVLNSTQAPIDRAKESYVLSQTVASGTLRGVVSYATVNKLIPVED